MPQAWQPASKSRHVDPAGYLSNRTIAALCSPVGGAICVLRISGGDAMRIASGLTDHAFVPADHRMARRAWIRDANAKKIDDAVILPFFGPNSFTGEDSVEFFLHGSPMVAQKVLDACFEQGARLALPGEFSFRAVKNGKMRLSQAEAVKELISAENDFSLELALEKLSGTQHHLVVRLREDLLQLCTLAEVGLDFSDQDVEEVSLPRLKQRLKPVLEVLRSLRGSFDRGKRFSDGVPVTIFGLPNAGKSSFFNALLGEDRSIVSDIAGTTRDVVRERLNLRGQSGQVTLKLADTAGLRSSSDSIEEIGIERSILSARDSDLVVVVIDGSDPELPVLRSYLDRIPLREGREFLFMVSKKDRMETADLERILSQVAKELGGRAHPVSSRTLEGIHEAAGLLADAAVKLLERKPGEVILTRFEHVRAVEQALGTLERAGDAGDAVLFAADLRHAMNDLGPLIGETLPDDVLGKIFSDFCIGK
jgi:tRNA modification GTPase